MSRRDVEPDRLDCDVAVIGGSLAGLRAAIAAADAGAAVVVLCRATAGSSGSAAVASNDLAGVLAECRDDSPAAFLEDLLASGHGIADPVLASIVAAEAGPRIEELARFGVRLLRGEGGVDRVQVPGHSRARGVRVEPLPDRPPGLALSLPLRTSAERLGVRLLDRCPALDLWCESGEAVGVLAVDAARGAPLAVRAGAVVLATGGGAYLYARTNGTRDVTADGCAMAARAGAELRDMEFVQFHSTRMDHPIRRMVPEGLMDDGAVLRNRDGEDFMRRYHPDGTMAPRDIRCRGIYEEIQGGRASDGYVYLDCSPIPADRLALRHAALVEQLRRAGLDFPRQPIQVSPAAHFFMGGVTIDSDGGTGVPGLYACGEVTGGVNGANRLGSVAYSEALVFGARAGVAAAATARRRARERRAPGGWPPGFPLVPTGPGAASAAPGWPALRRLMWEQAGVQRSAAGLGQALAALTELAGTIPDRVASWDAVAQIHGFRLALMSAEAVVRAALERRESRGAHWRADAPEPSERYRGSIRLKWRDGRWSLRFVHAVADDERVPSLSGRG